STGTGICPGLGRRFPPCPASAIRRTDSNSEILVALARQTHGGAVAKALSPGDMGGLRMKLVIAVISPNRLEAVREALPEPDAYVFYVNLVGDVRDPIHNCY